MSAGPLHAHHPWETRPPKAGERTVLILFCQESAGSPPPVEHLAAQLAGLGLTPELHGAPPTMGEFFEQLNESRGRVPLVLALGPPPEGEAYHRWMKWLDGIPRVLRKREATFASIHVAVWGGSTFKLPPALGGWPLHDLDQPGELERLGRTLEASLRADPERAGPPIPSMAIQYASVADVPAGRDAVGFKPYVDAIATFLSDPKTRPPLTLAIEGEWGSGKSSFMLQLEQALRTTGARKFVWFNAWRFDKDEALWASFALEFARQVAPRSLPARVFKRLQLAAKRLLAGRGWLLLAKVVLPLGLVGTATRLRPREFAHWDQMVSSIAALVLAPLSVPFAQRLWKFFGNPFSVDLTQVEDAPDYESRIPFLEQFHEDFQLISNTYVGQDEKVFVFVDDLDRCEVPRAAELLQALNLTLGDSGKLVFILGLDQEKVAAGIAIRNEKLLPLLAPTADGSPGRLAYDPVKAMEFGYDFLDRFIQLPFRIPRLTDRLDPMLDLLLGVGLPPKGPSALPPSAGHPKPPHSLDDAPRPDDLRRRAFMVRQADVDSPEIRVAMKMVAPLFGANPRRLKKFLNVFRLSVYIASETGLFDLRPEQPPLTLSKLAKFIALSLRWPKFLDDVDADPTLLAGLLSPGPEERSAAAAHWSQHQPLLDLLEYGAGEPQTYQLDVQDFEKLRAVAPAPTPMGGLSEEREKKLAG